MAVEAGMLIRRRTGKWRIVNPADPTAPAVPVLGVRVRIEGSAVIISGPRTVLVGSARDPEAARQWAEHVIAWSAELVAARAGIA
jgi:hypothetical protein